MPHIDYNIDVEDFLNECSAYEIEEIIDWLKYEGHLNKEEDDDDSEPTSVLQELYEENLKKIQNAYFQISKEDFELINQIAKKY